MNKPSIPQGTRDFSPQEMACRNYIFDTIKKYFFLYGFEQIETPAMENLDTLTGKYGEEGDQLLFKILNSRIHESGKKDELKSAFEQSLQSALNTKVLTERALRYDLTVPFARYVVQHRNDLVFPFKRFQIQPVWRADKPQKGRYREFFQCDADCIGSNSLINEVDLIRLMLDVFKALSIPVIIKFNNRKILSGIAELIGETDKLIAITVAIDKLDKIGKEGVTDELAKAGLTPQSIEKIEPLLDFKGTNAEKLKLLKKLFSTVEQGRKGIEECEYILSYFQENNPDLSLLELDITLARGLNYYTGAIVEVKANADTIKSSITGGGRYDDLTGVFGWKGMSGVGISFGIDRIFDVMNDLNLFPSELKKASSVKLLFENFGGLQEKQIMQLVERLRKAGISCEVYPDAVKENKQYDYAVKKGIPFVGIVDEEGLSKGVYELKNRINNERVKVSEQELIQLVLHAKT